MPAKVLILEDDKSVAALLTYNLEASGYEAVAAYTGLDAMAVINANRPDLLILDWMLPGKLGIDICSEIRASSETRNLPVLMLTARKDISDRLLSFERGADDFMVKPFSVAELLARVQALLTRTARATHTVILQHDGLSLDRQAHRVEFQSRQIALGPTEFRILEVLLERSGRVVSRSRLIELIWQGSTDVNERTVDVHVGNLRRTLAQHDVPALIRTIRGEGYVLG